jgi:hypothetical protein
MDDSEVEANWYDELAGALESLAARYRDAAAVLRIARGRLREGELEDLRAQLGAVTRRTIEALGVSAALPPPEGGGLK